MEIECPRCRQVNREIARFCARCGFSLEIGVDGSREAGRVRHPQPVELVGEYLPCEKAADLFFRTESSLGGAALIATEGVNVAVFNRGYPLCEVVLELRGGGDGDRELFNIERTLERLPQGREVLLEIPSYELPASLRALTVKLLSARFEAET